MKSEIIAYLQSHQYAKRADLLEYLFNIGLQVNDRMLRSCIENLIMSDGMCIASTDHGYRLIHSQNELMDAVEYLRKKARPIAIRANQLINNYQNINKAQLNITF
jgi:hypothetical protein